jgi:hypothetical protein
VDRCLPGRPGKPTKSFLEDVYMLRNDSNGPNVELIVEQVLGEIRCPNCSERPQVKSDRGAPLDLPVYGAPIRLDGQTGCSLNEIENALST